MVSSIAKTHAIVCLLDDSLQRAALGQEFSKAACFVSRWGTWSHKGLQVTHLTWEAVTATVPLALSDERLKRLSFLSEFLPLATFCQLFSFSMLKFGPQLGIISRYGGL